MPDKTPILELRIVDKSFGPIDVLHDIFLKVRKGETLCLLGDNGAGKTTLIKILAGHTHPPVVKSSWMATKFGSTGRGPPRRQGSRRCTSLAGHSRSCRLGASFLLASNRRGVGAPSRSTIAGRPMTSP